MLLDPAILTQISRVSIGPVSLHLYGIIIGIAVAAGLYTFLKIAPDSLRNKDKLPIVIALTIVFGIAGGRIGYVLGHIDEFPDLISILSIWKGGTTIFGVIGGGVIGAACGIRLFCTGCSFLEFLDYAAPAAALGQAVGRWANYVNQELYGLPSKLPWAIPINENHRFPGYAEVDSYHPAFLYESILDAASFVLLIFLIRKLPRMSPGFISGIYLINYGLIRIVMERIRIEAVPVLWIFKPADLAGFAFIISGGILIYHVRRKNRT